MIRTYLTLDVREGAAELLVDAFKDARILETSAAQPGCLSAEITVSANERKAIVTATWVDHESYARWVGRPDRGGHTDRLSEFLNQPIGAQTIGEILSVEHRVVGQSSGDKPSETPTGERRSVDK